MHTKTSLIVNILILMILPLLSFSCKENSTNPIETSGGIPTEAGWELFWNDEFSGASIDKTKWDFEIGNGQNGWGTGQIDYATNRTDNARVENGELLLTLKEENYGGKIYTSSRMITKNKQNFTYGKFEIRAKGVYGTGYGFAFWMLGSKYEQPGWGWPVCGEIDIFELDGGRPNFTIGTAHFNESWGHNYSQGKKTLPLGQNFYDEYHTYTLVWDTTSIEWYVDGSKINTLSTAKPINGLYPFSNPFFLILSTGVGGQYTGNPDATTPDKWVMYVDYIRVFKRKAAK